MKDCCLDCPDRDFDCHSKCVQYKNLQAWHERVNKKRRELSSSVGWDGYNKHNKVLRAI